ncbi:hypothetical protein K466DRAFT_475956 [Polyporus arcularius HHB13444]|uniref:BTB domain-containing protein n=1 Tax=Polyporus arcularius HHB13444 TaxID=1314778 RepID=A0A5C3Q0H8_9APHY|nr:hypothetical protein K466DRAFT_475956 [Polyporus arcularius HHB13444]
MATSGLGSSTIASTWGSRRGGWGSRGFLIPGPALQSAAARETHTTTNPSSVVHQAFLASITGRAFEDVKFFAFSRRTRTGSVDSPRPLLANSALLCSAAPHFDYSNSRHFAEGRTVDLDAPYPAERPSVVDNYDYTSDSDLEDEPPRVVNQHVMRTGLGETSTPERGVEDSEGPPIIGEATTESADPSSIRVPEDVPPIPIIRQGRVVFLQDVAYRTFKAFIFYAYTREVEFAPLKSQHQAYDQGSEDTPPQCSPKSMYRMAEMYDIPELKDQSLNNLRSKLTPDNILEEIFSRFTSLHPAIQAMELQYLHANMNDTAVQARLPMWIEAMQDGALPRGAADIVVSLITTDRQLPSTPSGPGTRLRCPNSCLSSGYRCSSCYHTLQ